jgi:hypothetical protein
MGAEFHQRRVRDGARTSPKARSQRSIAGIGERISAGKPRAIRVYVEFGKYMVAVPEVGTSVEM